MVRHLLAGSTANFLISFTSLVVMARLFPLDFIADAKAVSVYGGWFSVAFTFQVHAAFLFFYRENAPQERCLKALALSFVLLAATVSAGAFFVVFPAVYRAVAIDTVGLTAFSITVGLNLIFAVSPAIYTALNASNRLTRVMFLYPVATLCSLLLSYSLDLDVNGYAWLLCSASFSVLALTEWRSHLIFVLRNYRLPGRGYSAEFGNYAGRTSVSILFETLGDRLDKFVASRVFGPSVFGKYSVVCFENPIVGVVLNSYGLALVKRFHGGTRGREDSFLQVWRGMVRMVTFVTLPISVFLLLNHEWFIATVFGERFLDVGLVFQIYLTVSLIRYAPFQALLRLEGAVQYNVAMALGFVASACVVAAAVVWMRLRWDLVAFAYFAGWLAFNGMAVHFFHSLTGIRTASVLALDIWAARLAQCLFAGFTSRFLAAGNVYLGGVLFALLYLAVVLSWDRDVRGVLGRQWKSWRYSA